MAGIVVPFRGLAGKQRLTLQVEQEAEQCGFTLNTDVPAPDPSTTP